MARSPNQYRTDNTFLGGGRNGGGACEGLFDVSIETSEAIFSLEEIRREKPTALAYEASQLGIARVKIGRLIPLADLAAAPVDENRPD